MTATGGALQRDLESKHFHGIDDERNCSEHYKYSQHKTPLLKKKHSGVYLKFSAEYLEKPTRYKKDIVWSEENEIGLLSLQTL